VVQNPRITGYPAGRQQRAIAFVEPAKKPRIHANIKTMTAAVAASANDDLGVLKA
jgi:hypothetical protein